MVGKRTVAFLDILGFRNLVATTPIAVLGPKFATTMALVGRELNRPIAGGGYRLLNDRAPDQPFCLTYSFSDSIILISDDASSSSCLAVLVFAIKAMQALLASGFPVRAGAAFGEMYVDLPRSVFLGPALTSAYDIEQSQDWVGGLLDDTLAEPFRELFAETERSRLLGSLFPRYPVPLKTGGVRDCRTLNWRWNLVAKYGTRSLFRDSADAAAMTKIANALAYAKWVRREGLAYPVDSDAVPVEMQRFFIGDEAPPPSYGQGDDW